MVPAGKVLGGWTRTRDNLRGLGWGTVEGIHVWTRIGDGLGVVLCFKTRNLYFNSWKLMVKTENKMLSTIQVCRSRATINPYKY